MRWGQLTLDRTRLQKARKSLGPSCLRHFRSRSEREKACQVGVDTLCAQEHLPSQTLILLVSRQEITNCTRLWSTPTVLRVIVGEDDVVCSKGSFCRDSGTMRCSTMVQQESLLSSSWAQRGRVTSRSTHTLVPFKDCQLEPNRTRRSRRRCDRRIKWRHL